MITEGLVTECEKNFAWQIRTAVQTSLTQNKKIILLAGASCAGKTTTSRILTDAFKDRGYSVEMISLDDFYAIQKPLAEGELPDYEAPEALDLKLLSECLEKIVRGDPVEVPTFDFEKKSRVWNGRIVDTEDDTIIVFEGLHALNPLISGGAREAFRIYISCESDEYDAKLLRRIVRDYNYRGASPVLTFSWWDNVKNGEMKYIRPYKGSADVCINSLFAYERSALRDEALAILKEVPKDSIYKEKADEISEMLLNVESMDVSLIPTESLLREFIGKI